MQKKKSVKAWWELHGWGVIGLGCHLDLFIAQCLSQECHSCGLKYERRLFVKSNVQHVGHKRWQWRWWCGCKHRNAFFPPFFFYRCSITFVPILGVYKSSPLTYPPHLPLSILLPHCLWPWVFYTCSLMIFSLHSPVFPLLPPLWSLSVCSLFLCLWFYFACLFVLLIRLPL